VIVLGFLNIFKSRKKETDLIGLNKLDASLGLPKDMGAMSPGFEGQPLPGQQQQFGMPQESRYPQQQFAYSQYPQFQQPSAFQDNQTYVLAKNMELISAKLDSIQIALQNINQRIANLEMRIRERGW